MKKFKKILTGCLAVATLGCVSLTPMVTNAIIYYEENIGDSSVSLKEKSRWCAERAITEAIIIVDIGSEVTDGTYYYNYNDGEFPIEIDDNFDTTGIGATVIYHGYGKETILSVDGNDIVYSGGIIIDTGYYYTRMHIDEETGWHSDENAIPKYIESDSTSITEFTVGESTYPRGDINLDGKVNTLDLLMLKKYLLGLMEW